MTRTRDRLSRAARSVGTAWGVVGVVILMIVALEGTLRLAFAAKDALSGPLATDPRVIAEGYGGASWPAALAREQDRARGTWEPYLYFRQQAFNGRQIHVNAHGERATWQGAKAGAGSVPPKQVFILGGSAVWGLGARDDFTIPSLLARELSRRGLPVRVRNLGELGRVSTQEVIALIRQLQAGARPDLVIFYDGVNDVVAAVQEGEAGLPQNEEHRRWEYSLRTDPARLAVTLGSALVSQSATYRLASGIGRRLQGTPGRNAQPRFDDRLASDVLRVYSENQRIVAALGREYGFEALFYWQPTVFSKPGRAPYETEQAALSAPLGVALEAVRGRIDEGVRPPNGARFRDLSGIFNESNDLVFIDFCHTTEAANARIAREMADDAARALVAGESRAGGGP